MHYARSRRLHIQPPVDHRDAADIAACIATAVEGNRAGYRGIPVERIAPCGERVSARTPGVKQEQAAALNRSGLNQRQHHPSRRFLRSTLRLYLAEMYLDWLIP